DALLKKRVTTIEAVSLLSEKPPFDSDGASVRMHKQEFYFLSLLKARFRQFFRISVSSRFSNHSEAVHHPSSSHCSAISAAIFISQIFGVGSGSGSRQQGIQFWLYMHPHGRLSSTPGQNIRDYFVVTPRD
ncbi:unnamed protein product, partial [Closterium sp. NIES-53]